MGRKRELINLIEEIEETKDKLYNLIYKNRYNLSAPNVITLSEYLDELIKDYYNQGWRTYRTKVLFYRKTLTYFYQYYIFYIYLK